MGNPFTWSNGMRNNDYVMEKLDRAVAIREWQKFFHKVQVNHLPRYRSDYAPILICCTAADNDNILPKKSPRLRFEYMWLRHPNFPTVLRQHWKDTEGAENLVEKLKFCNAGLSRWARKEFEDSVVHQIQANETELDEVLRLEKTRWYQRSRALWLRFGDKNSKFYNQKASQRKIRNMINSVEDEGGRFQTKQEDMQKVFVDYFSEYLL